MATISVAIAVRDEVEANRKKQGDIIAIMPGGWQWGGMEVKSHLILEIALPSQVTIDMAEALVSKYFAGGVLSVVDESSEVLAKRRFKVDWAILKTVLSKAGLTVDWAKVENVTVAYQPLSSQIAAPGGKNTSLDPTKLVMDKYENRIIRAAYFSTFITG